MLANGDAFEVRSTESYELSDSSAGESHGSRSLESLVAEGEDISETIK